MALARVHESEEEDEYHSLSGHEPDNGDDDESGLDSEADVPPVHPVSALQGAFEESIRESTEEEDASAKAKVNENAESRRQKLLAANQYDDSWTTRWRQRSSAKYHPLLKLMAQIVFGMHLLQQQQAKSNEEVVKILQTHVNEVDSFLERTSDDFNLAINDIEDRVKHLRLPMSHLDTFNTMLDDKKFRTQLIEGNDRIDLIIERTAKAMHAALMDVQRGLEATQELGGYLDNVKNAWPRGRQDLVEVFGAMRGNERGWLKYLYDLQTKGNSLDSHLIQLGTVIREMSKLAAAASRRNRPQSRQISPTRSAPTSPGLRSKFSNEITPISSARPSMSQVLNKPLPREPDAAGGAARTTISQMHPVPFAQRYESPRASPHSPTVRKPINLPATTDAETQRPETSGRSPRQARVSKSNTNELAEFLRHSGPIRSKPPDAASLDASRGKRPQRSKSHGAQDMLNVMTAGANGPVGDVPLLPTTERRPSADLLRRPLSKSSVLERRSLSRPRTAVVEKAPSVKSGKFAPNSKEDSGPTSGFTRRISMRMKHLPPSDSGPLAGKPVIKEAREPTQPKAATATIVPRPPADSAYGSDPEKIAPLRSSTEPMPRISRPATALSPGPSTQRPPSRFGLFPRSTAPPATSGARITSNDNSSLLSGNARGKDVLPNVLSASTTSSPARTSRMASVRNIFRKR